MAPTPRPQPDHQQPKTYPAYATTADVPLVGDLESVTLGLKATGLDAYFRDGQVLHFDLAGRLVRVGQPNIQWRRGLSGRVIELRRRRAERGGGLARCRLSGDQSDRLITAAHERMECVWNAFCPNAVGSDNRASQRDHLPAPAVDQRLTQAVALAAAFDLRTANSDLARFRAIYHDVPILPPDQYNSLVLLASDGCRYNRCTFCGFYRDAPFRTRSLAEFREHVEQAVAYHGRGLAQRRSIFLGQANALLGARDWRTELLRYLNQRFDFPAPDRSGHQPDWWKGSTSGFAEITSFLDAFVGIRIGADEFAAMRELNLRRIFIGMETGNAELLQWLRKPAQPQQILDTVHAARLGGVNCGVIVLLGAGGERFFDTHVRDSVALIRAMPLTTGDFVYLSPLVAAPGTEYAELALAAGIEPLSAARLAEQERLIRQGIRFQRPTARPYIAHYNVEHFIY